MSGDPQADLTYAILAMDSYNRGYGVGITGLSTGQSVGGYRILNFDLPTGSFAAGFSATAYEDATGNVIISFRGTDAPALNDEAAGGSDPHGGYGLAFGLPGAGTVDFNIAGTTLSLTAEQGRLAEEFYNKVKAEVGGSITLTGHSLGGGLAGYIGSVFHEDAVLINHMPFGLAAQARAAQLGRPRLEHKK